MKLTCVKYCKWLDELFCCLGFFYFFVLNDLILKVVVSFLVWK